MSNDELSLADAVEVDEDLTVDSTVEPTPDDFDLDAWIDGVRPTRKSVKLYPQGHLIARLEQIAEEIDELPDGPECDAKIDEFEKVREQFKTGVWFTVEQRSTEWIEKFRKQKAKALKLDEDDDAATLSVYQMAEQVVQPEGLTFNHLKQLRESNEGEWAKLLDAQIKANQNLAQSSGVMKRDFSERRSAATRD